MRLLILPILILVHSLNCSLEGIRGRKSIDLSHDIFSSYQGQLSWFDAKKRCESIEMRLPTREELKMIEVEPVHKAKMIESWEDDGIYYWTSDEISSTAAYCFVIINSYSITYNKNIKLHVRCYR